MNFKGQGPDVEPLYPAYLASSRAVVSSLVNEKTRWRFTRSSRVRPGRRSGWSPRDMTP